MGLHSEFKGPTPSLSFQSPAHSSSSYDSGRNEGADRGAEDPSLPRGAEDEEDHAGAEGATQTDGVEAERLKAFNVSPAHSRRPDVLQLHFMLLLVGKCGYVRDMFV